MATFTPMPPVSDDLVCELIERVAETQRRLRRHARTGSGSAQTKGGGGAPWLLTPSMAVPSEASGRFSRRVKHLLLVS